MRLLPLLTLLTALGIAGAAKAEQIADRITQEVDATQVQPLPNHFPQWANSANDLGAVPPDTEIDRFTIVLARSPQQQAEFAQFLADQQNPGSPEYHRWLTPEQVGERFGLTQSDVAAVSGWLQSQGLHIVFVSPSRIFIGFGGKAGDLGRAFHTELHNYKVSGDELVSVSSVPMIPRALSPVIMAVRGIFTVQDKPLHHSQLHQMDSPAVSFNGNNFVGPADFATIYDLPSAQTGTGETIGIVGESRTDTADFTNYRALTGSTFPNPTEIIPTTFGGADPGLPVTTPVQNPPGAQGEAELDVTRSGTVAPGATIDLVVASQASGGIDPAAQYLVHTSPVPAQVMSISFGACELNAGPVNVAYWDSLFQIAASEGISVFVASGDSGASGCDPYNALPPASPQANSPNYICSSSYATCVGGTEFNDASNPGAYWGSNNPSTLGSALSYIPEGAWNDPVSQSSTFQAASTGGGVSTVIPTPSWQTGTGVPSARAGRYTPDISFSSAEHDGYFGCFAAGGGDCVSSGGGYSFESFSGTSAAAPDMAGVTVLLDQKLGAAQGNLNQNIYTMAANVPAAFHDVTVASSGVSGCAVTTPSMCNNSAPSPSSLTGGQAGFLVDTGYDEATGWGSLDVTQFINNFTTTTTPQAPTATTGAATAVTSSTATIAGTVNPNGAATTVWFLYGTSSTLTGATQTPTQALTAGTTATPVTANLTGLAASTTYYFEVVAQNATGTTDGTIANFTTPAPPAKPTATTGAASAITSATATVAATVNPNGGDTHVWFLYGTSSSLTGATQTASQDLGSGSVATAVTANLTGLTASTTYYFQIVAQNVTGTTSGSIVSFATPAPPPVPTVTTGLATAITSNTATVAGTVNPNGGATTVWFLYGTSSTLAGASQTSTQSIGSGTTAVAATANLTGLNASTTYYFQAVAQNVTGTTKGAIVSFTTTAVPLAPTATTGVASAVAVTSAAVAGTVNPNAQATNVWFLYGTSSTLVGATQTTTQAIGSGTTAVAVNANLTGLNGSTTYYFQVVAQNATGTTNGSIVSFTTLAPPTFTIAGTAVSVAPGATTGNTSTITVTPQTGFTGTVSMTCAFVANAANDPATCSMSPASLTNFTGTTPQTSTLTISTTAATTSLNQTRKFFWPTAGGAALALMLFFGIPARRRSWRAMLGMIALLVALAGGLAGCNHNTPTPTGNAGTTAGTYSVTITGTSGSLTVTSPSITVTVQ